MLQECSENCGWIAAVVAALAYGSFGVPIKSKTSSRLDIDPLVMQTYKTVTCFLTCWLVVGLGEPIRFTPWGIVSGLFWVPGATCGIFGIRNAGLAVAVGTWSSIIVVVSFAWGILVFKEGVKHAGSAACAICLLISGLLGMARYSSPSKNSHPTQTTPTDKLQTSEHESKDIEIDDFAEEAVSKRKRVTSQRSMIAGVPGDGIDGNNKTTVVEETTTSAATAAALTSSEMYPLEMEPLVEGKSKLKEGAKDPHDVLIVLFRGRLPLTRRQAGILGAVINGAWGGTNLIPMHYAHKDGFGGANYLISFATGSMLVTIVCWMIRWAYVYFAAGGSLSVMDSYRSLPAFHFRQMWIPGFLAGTLYSIGNFCSILAVTYLGQGVGYSFCQSAMLVSGLWGIFYFGEIKGKEIICKWIMSALVTIAGMIWLSYEHESSASH